MYIRICLVPVFFFFVMFFSVRAYEEEGDLLVEELFIDTAKSVNKDLPWDTYLHIY